MSKSKLRKNDGMFDKIVGKLLPTLEAKMYSQLPTNGEVLRYYLYLTRFDLKLTSKKEVASVVCEKVNIFWKMAGITTKQKKDVVRMILHLIRLRENLIKNAKKKCYEAQILSFTNKLLSLFDIAASNAEDLIRKDTSRSINSQISDINFLLDQRCLKKQFLGPLDKSYTMKLKRKEQKKAQEIIAIEKEKSRRENIKHKSFSISTAFNDKDKNPDKNEESPIASPEKKIKILENPKVSLMADRLNLSSRERSGIILAVAEALGHNLDDISISKSTANRSGNKTRQQVSDGIKKTFISPMYSSIHWDSKLVSEVDGKVERLAIVVTGKPSAPDGKLLCVSRIPNTTGQSQATATIDAVKAWKLEKSLVAMVFDTTPSNSGWINGSAKLIEKHFNKKLLWCACRHHILERILSSVYLKVFGECRSPNYEPFRHFKNEVWPKLSLTSDTNFRKIKIEEPVLKTKQAELIIFLSDLLNRKSGKILRDDYRECCQLALQLLNPKQTNIQWNKPGAFHHARWMCSILYTSKMFAFADLAEYEESYIEKLSRFCKFALLFYVKIWITCPNTINAPFNDLEFYKEMLIYKKIDNDVAVAALEAFNRHLWYLTEEMVPLSLFSDKVSLFPYFIIIFHIYYDKVSLFSLFSDISLFSDKVSDCEKTKIAKTILKNIKENCEHDIGFPQFPLLKQSTCLTDLIGPKSIILLNLFGYSNQDDGWLAKSPKFWKANTNFKHMFEHIKSLKSVNDTAERAVKLSQDFAKSITKDEEQKEFLLCAVEHHRKVLPRINKQAIQELNF